MPTNRNYRRFYQNPYFQVFPLTPEEFTGREYSLEYNALPPEAAPAIGRWYFGPSPLHNNPPANYPLDRFGPYKSHAKALEAAREYFSKL